jgi:microcystin-dependent protein
MPDTFTPNYNLTKVEVGGSTDTWGTKINANSDVLDTQLKAQSTLLNTTKTTADAALPRSGGVMTGDVDMGGKSVLNASDAGLLGFSARPTAPPGWIKCNGAAISRTTYANLFAAIGTTHGAGDGTSTFNLPDYRGLFPRGLDDGKGIDTGRALGSLQDSQNLAHNHGINDPGHVHGVNDGGHNHGVNDPGHSHPFGASYIGSGIGSNGGYVNATNNNGATTGASGTGIWLNASGANVSIANHATGVSIQNDGGAEARPKNFAALIVIKY